MPRRSIARCAAQSRTGRDGDAGRRSWSAACATLVCAGALLAACSANDDVPSPRVSNITPDHAPVGVIVTLNGNYFCQRPEQSEDPLCDVVGEVHFGAAPGTPTLWSETAISVEVPSGVAGRVGVTVIAGGRTSNSVPFTAE